MPPTTACTWRTLGACDWNTALETTAVAVPRSVQRRRSLAPLPRCISASPALGQVSQINPITIWFLPEDIPVNGERPSANISIELIHGSEPESLLSLLIMM